MLRLHPELVDMKQVPVHPPAAFPPYDVYPTDISRVPSSRALCSAKIATADKGTLLLGDYVDGISRAIAEEFNLADIRSAAE